MQPSAPAAPSLPSAPTATTAMSSTKVFPASGSSALDGGINNAAVARANTAHDVYPPVVADREEAMASLKEGIDLLRHSKLGPSHSHASHVHHGHTVPANREEAMESLKEGIDILRHSSLSP